MSGPPGPSVPPGSGRRLAQLAELPVTVLRGVGSRWAGELGALGIESVLDLLTHYPRRHVDATNLVSPAGLQVGQPAALLATVRSVRRPPVRGGRGRRVPARVELVVGDGDGAVRVVFFNQTWRAHQLPAGTTALFFGKPTAYQGQLQLVNPTVEVVQLAGDGTGGTDGTADDDGSGVDGSGDSGSGDSGEDAGRPSGRIYAVYPLSEASRLTSVQISRFVGEALDRAGDFADPLDAGWRQRVGVVGRTEAFGGIHRPHRMAEREPARRRLAFDELFRLQLALVLRQARLAADARGIRHVVTRPDGTPTLVDRFIDGLPFDLTAGQRRAVDQILADLAGPLPMHRLLQGDVGAGKTVVAVATLLCAVEGGHQGAFMAPTEVLAEQHRLGIEALLDGLSVPDPTTLAGARPVSVELLTSRTGAAARRRIRDGLAGGGVDLVIGTHALLTDDVRFASLGAVVIDEQHRFGVEQRAALRSKGRGADGAGHDPDLLVMTATPIPRTAAMVVFGDLDMTVVDDRPPGRTPVTTEWARTSGAAAGAWERVRHEVAAGHRAFVVCPLVEGSDRVEATAATDESARLASTELAGLRVGLLHGQLPATEKEAVMAAFRAGQLDVLVATTVVEVGVDVPEATVMVIEDADRFGIAQLHQLRGRVGRGSDPSWCYLLSEVDTPEVAERLGAMERTTDGFELADVDLRLRGAGTILGARQKGRSDLRLADLVGDRDLVEVAREVATAMIGPAGTLDAHPLLADELRLFLDEEEAEFLFKS